MKKCLDKLNKIACNTVLIFSLLFAIGIVLSNVFFLGKNVLDNTIWNLLAGLLAVVIVSVIIYFMIKINNNKIFVIAIFLLSVFIRIIWILAVDTTPVSDFSIMYDGAIKIVDGSNNNYFANDLYFSSWVYQLGFTSYLACLYKLFNGSLFAIKLINVFIVSLIPLIIYKISDKLVSEKISKVAALWYNLYFSSIAYTSVLTNQHITTLFCYAAIYFIITKFNSKWGFILSGVLIGIAHIIRPEGSLLLFAVFLFVTFKSSKLDKKHIFNILKSFAMVLIVFSLTSLFSNLLINIGVTTYDFGNRNPLWKFVEGLNYDTNGSYSEEDNELLYYVPIGEEKFQIEKNLIRERISDPIKVAKLFGRKFVIFWGGNDNSFSFIYTDEQSYKNYNDLSVIIEKFQYFIIFVFFLFGVIGLLKTNKFKNSHLLLILFLGYVFVHLIIEIQIRYRYFIMPSIIIIAASGLEYILNKKRLI